MYYTKLIIEDCAERTLDDTYFLVLDERWKFIDDGNGRTKFQRSSPTDVWDENGSYNTLTSVQSKEMWDVFAANNGSVFLPSETYHESIRIWNTESAAQGWVTAVQALNLDNVTISYHGTTDPTA